MAQLFERCRIGNVELKNRIGMSPMGFAHTDADGSYSDRQITYYEERAKGGYGLIYPTTSKVCSQFESSPVPNILQNNHQARRVGMICDRIHQYGGKVCLQLSIGLGRVNAFVLPGEVPMSASAVPYFWDPSITCTPYTKEQIAVLVESFAKSARLAKNTGADMIEMHAYGGYLIDQFISKVWNHRDDEYGGSLDNRLRIVFEIRDAIRKACGPDYPIVIKLTPVHGFEGGRTLEEGIELLKRLDDEGFAAFHLDYGSYECWYNAVPTVYQPEGCQLFIAEAAKKAGIKTPLIVQGKLFDPERVKKVVEDGIADVVLQGHPSLADPYWPKKAKYGCYEDIRPCIGCNECLNLDIYSRPQTCAVNPQLGMEKDWALTPAPEKMDVLVVGAGPGGMACAITAARRGFHVELWEKSDRLGGALNAAGAPAFKRDVKRYVDYLTAQVRKLGIDVRLGKEATAEAILSRDPDAVVLSAGSSPIVPKITGLENITHFDANTMLISGECPGEKVVVLGGGLVGCETALHLDQCGKDVTIVELLDSLLLTADHSPNNDQAIRRMLADSNIKSITGARLTEAKSDGVVIEKDGSKSTIPCDTLITAIGYRSSLALRDELEEKMDRVYTIGDNVKPGKIIDAVSQGFHTARLLENLD